MTDEMNEHECPRPLEEQVAEFDVGGMFLSPAGRWETVTDRSPFTGYSPRVSVYTDRTGPDYCWTFWRSQRFPYLPPWLASQHRHVAVFEAGSAIFAEVTEARSLFGHGHTVVSASLVRGTGWLVTDCPDGRTVEQVTVPSKARARSEVNRRARAHAKRLGVPMRRERPDSAPTTNGVAA